MRIYDHALDEAVEAGLPPAARAAPPRSPFWSGLARTGSALWLDTGDATGAEELWTGDFTGIAIDGSHLRGEVESGACDDFLRAIAPLLDPGDGRSARLEAAFALAGRHALRLAKRFACTVAVALHTDLAEDVAGSVEYGLRYHALDPAHLMVRLPATPEGLVAARVLGDHGVRTGIALGFSARQNLVAAAVARPAFVDLPIGRLAAYLQDNDLGDGTGIGERALRASRRAVDSLGLGTRQIATGLRSPHQLLDLAGCDVFALQPAIARAAPRELAGAAWSPAERPLRPLSPAPGLARARPETAWLVEPAVEDLAADLLAAPAATPEELLLRCSAFGCNDLFPAWTGEERARLATDGRIPLHHRWIPRIERGTAAIDSLLAGAGLEALAADHAAADGHALGILAA